MDTCNVLTCTDTLIKYASTYSCMHYLLQTRTHSLTKHVRTCTTDNFQTFTQLRSEIVSIKKEAKH